MATVNVNVGVLALQGSFREVRFPELARPLTRGGCALTRVHHYTRPYGST